MKKDSKRPLKGAAAAVIATSIVLTSVPPGVLASTEGNSVTDSVYGGITVTQLVYGTESLKPTSTVTNSVYADATDFTYVTLQFDNGTDKYDFAVITGYKGSSSDVVIPDTIDGYPVRWIDKAFAGNTEVTSVTIPDGVNKIFSGSFGGATNLQSVNIPSGVTVIEDGVFAGTGLSSIEIPAGVTSIGSSAFSSTKLKNVVIPTSVTNIDMGAFAGSYNLNSIVIENPNTTISTVPRTIPQQATVVGQAGSVVESYAVANRLAFQDIASGTHVPDFDTGAQDPLSRYHRGEDVVVNEIFKSDYLAIEFAEWLSEEIRGSYGESTPVWYGDVNSTFNKHDVESRVFEAQRCKGFVTFGNASGNEGLTSLEGIQVFDKTIFVNPKVVKNLYFNNNDLTEIGPLSFLPDVYDLFLSGGRITNLDGLSGLRTARNISLYRNKIRDVKGLGGIQSITGQLALSNNELTNREIADLTAVIEEASPANLDLSYNYLVQNNSESEYFFSSLAGKGAYRFSPQYNFVFSPVDSVKVEYRVKGTDELLGSDVHPYTESSTINAKSFAGYSLESSSSQKVAAENKAGGSLLVPTIKLKGINQPDPLTSISPNFVDWAGVSYLISDNSVLTYDSANRKLNTLTTGETGLDVLENGVYRGTYNISTNVSTGTPIVFYYTPVAPTEFTLTVQKVGNGTVFPNEGTHTYPANEFASLSSNNSDPGFVLEKWVIDGIDYFYPNPFSTSLPIKMDGNKVAVAHFKPVQQEKFQLSVTQEGEGVITPYPTGSSVELAKSEPVNLTATPAEGYSFEKWVVNGITYTTPTVSFTMNADISAKAYFNAQPIKVNIGFLTVEFRDVDSLDEIKEKLEFRDLPLGVNQVIAEELIGAYKLLGDTLQEVILTATEPFKKLTFFYKKEVEQPPIVPPTEPPVVEPPVVVAPTEPPVVEPPVVVAPTEPPVVEPPVEVAPTEPPVVEPPVEVAPTEPPKIQQPEQSGDPSSSVPKQEVPVVIVTPTPSPKPNPESVIVPKPNPEPKTEQEPGSIVNPTPSTESKPSPVDQIVGTAPVIVESPTNEKPEVKPTASQAVPKQVLGTIFGVIKDSSGNPMVGIQVELHSRPRITYTDAEGKYSFDQVELGKHTILLKNPVTSEESRIEVIVYEDQTNNTSSVKSTTLKDAPEVELGVQLDERANMQRIDFVIEPIQKVEEQQPEPTPEVNPEPNSQPTPSPQTPGKEEPKKDIPVKPFLPFILVVLLPFFRKNVVVYNGQGLKLKKLRVKPKDESVIDLTGLAAEEFEIIFKRPSQFRDKSIQVKYGDKLSDAITLQDDQNSIIFNPEQ